MMHTHYVEPSTEELKKQKREQEMFAEKTCEALEPLRVTINFGARRDQTWNELRDRFGQHDCVEALMEEFSDWYKDWWKVHFVGKETFRLTIPDFAYIEFDIKENTYFIGALKGMGEPELTLETTLKLARIQDIIKWFNESNKVGVNPAPYKQL